LCQVFCDSFKIQKWRLRHCDGMGHNLRNVDYNTKYSPIMVNQMLLPDMEKKRWLVTYRHNHVKMAWAFINIMNGIHHLGCYILICERTTSCLHFLPDKPDVVYISVYDWGEARWVHPWLGYTKGMLHPKITFKTLLWMTITFTIYFFIR
jgi:hypothetical protein